MSMEIVGVLLDLVFVIIVLLALYLIHHDIQELRREVNSLCEQLEGLDLVVVVDREEE